MPTKPVRNVRPRSQADDPRNLWLVVAFVQPFKLDDVTLALERVEGFAGMTVSECRGFGHEKLETVRSAGGGVPAQSEQLTDFTSKVKVEVAVSGSEVADAVVDAIARAAHTGRRGDGKILQLHVERAVRVRTMDEGTRAL
jgi:nitrogen regulatory protein PII